MYCCQTTSANSDKPPPTYPENWSHLVKRHATEAGLDEIVSYANYSLNKSLSEKGGHASYRSWDSFLFDVLVPPTLLKSKHTLIPPLGV